MNHPNWINERLTRSEQLARRRRLAILVGILALVLLIGLLAGCSPDRPSQVAVSGVTHVTEDPCDLSGCRAPTTHTTSTTVPPSSTTQPTVPATVATTLPPTTTTTSPPVETAAASEPVVAEVQPEPGSVKAIIHEIFGGEGDYAVRIFTCESKLNPSAVSPTDDHGVAQINAPTFNQPGHSDEIADWIGRHWGSIYDPRTNLIGAKMIRDKYGWSAWACA